MRIRAAVLRHPGTPVEVEDVELDRPKAYEVLVRVAAAGVCHSDVRHADGDLGPGKWPSVMGHEGAGVVEAVGAEVTHVSPGDHVALCFVPACRRCRYCRAGKPNLCAVVAKHGATGMLMDGTSRLRLPDGTTLQHGLRTACFAEYTVVAAGGAVRVPEELPLWQAALLGCGVVTGAGAVANIAVDRVPEKLELAKAHGATHVIDATSPDSAVDTIRSLTVDGVDFAFEVVGRPETIRLAWDAIRSGGTAVVVGLAPDGVEASGPAIGFL